MTNPNELVSMTIAQYEQIRNQAIEEAAQECDRHATFLKDEARKGGNWQRLMTRNEEALWNAQSIRRLKST